MDLEDSEGEVERAVKRRRIDEERLQLQYTGRQFAMAMRGKVTATVKPINRKRPRTKAFELAMGLTRVLSTLVDKQGFAYFRSQTYEAQQVPPWK